MVTTIKESTLAEASSSTGPIGFKGSINPPSNLTTYWDKAASIIFEIASYLADPPCKVSEYWKQILVVDVRYSDSSYLINQLRKVVLFIQLIGCAFLSLFTALPGIGLRALAASLQTKPYLFMKAQTELKTSYILVPVQTY